MYKRLHTSMLNTEVAAFRLYFLFNSHFFFPGMKILTQYTPYSFHPSIHPSVIWCWVAVQCGSAGYSRHPSAQQRFSSFLSSWGDPKAFPGLTRGLLPVGAASKTYKAKGPKRHSNQMLRPPQLAPFDTSGSTLSHPTYN